MGGLGLGEEGHRMWDLKERNDSDTPASEAREPNRDGAGGADAAAWVRTRLALPVDAVQARVRGTTSKRGILNWCRQW